MSATAEGLNLVTRTTPPPRRVTLSRKRGWTMPANTMKVDRSTPYGNPFRLGDTVAGEVLETMEQVLDAYRRWAAERLHDPSWQKLRGRNLACWCRPEEPCHADVLLELLTAATA